MNAQIVQERLAQLEKIRLGYGSHKSFNDGVCAMELVSYIAGEPHSDHPECACPILTSFVIKLNDRWSDEQRQALKPYLPKLVGTRDRKKERARALIAVHFAYREALPKVLDIAGLVQEAGELREWPQIRELAWTKRQEAWAKLTSEQRVGAYAAYAVAVAAAADAAAADAYDAAYDAAAAKTKLIAIRDELRQGALDTLQKMIDAEVAS